MSPTVDPGQRYLLVKRGLYYGPNNNGYTGFKERAGRYDASEADEESGVTAIHEDEADEIAPKCFDDLARDWLNTKLTMLRQEAEALRLALEPFAAMGRVMETRARVTFGKVPKDSEIVCESSGEAGMGILTMGHFRDASALLPDAPGWGGMYKPHPIRAKQDTPS